LHLGGETVTHRASPSCRARRPALTWRQPPLKSRGQFNGSPRGWPRRGPLALGLKEIMTMLQDKHAAGSPSDGWSEPRATALLVLQDGTVLEGFGIGATGE